MGIAVAFTNVPSVFRAKKKAVTESKPADPFLASNVVIKVRPLLGFADKNWKQMSRAVGAVALCRTANQSPWLANAGSCATSIPLQGDAMPDSKLPFSVEGPINVPWLAPMNGRLIAKLTTTGKRFIE